MWLVRSILVFAAIVAILIFAIGNVENRTDIRLFTKTYTDVHVNLALLIAGLFGAAVSFLALIFREFALRATVRKLRRENLKLDDELTALRNLPLSGMDNEPTEPTPKRPV